MKILKYGSTGPNVQLLQLALNRAQNALLDTDGVFGERTRNALIRFQAENGLSADGIAGPQTQAALRPWYTGVYMHRVRQGDTLWSISRMHGVSLESIVAANPGIDPASLVLGSTVKVPLPFSVVPTDIDWSSDLVAYCAEGLPARYPFLKSSVIGSSVMGKPLYALSFGTGANRVVYNASHHANEWICTPMLFKYIEELCRAYASGGVIFGQSAAELYRLSTVIFVPAVNPDGIDLVTGAICEGEYFDAARRIAARYPSIPFPSGWKANIRGVDLNLQYPAGWETARDNKFALGFVSPAPADYVGSAPLVASESRAMYDFTMSVSPALTLSYHSQGRVIYWKYADYEPPRSRQIAESFAAVSGYSVEDTPYASGFAGYKDWFIQNFNRPGYTIEVGLGTNPLPLSQFDGIYSENLGILTYGALATL